jgi:predicted nucleic acid-binding protein
MLRYLLDANICIHVLKCRPDSAWQSSIAMPRI